MKATPRTLLIARAIAILLLGLGAGPTARLIVYLVFDPDMWSDIWARRSGGPIAIVANLLLPWLEVLVAPYFWATSGPPFVAAIAGAVLLFRTRFSLRHCPAWVMR